MDDLAKLVFEQAQAMNSAAARYIALGREQGLREAASICNRLAHDYKRVDDNREERALHEARNVILAALNAQKVAEGK